MDRHAHKSNVNEAEYALNVRDVAAIIGVAASTAEDHRWRRRVGLRAFGVGRVLRFRKSDVLDLLDQGLER
jgi:hypothetical protein